MKEKDFKLSLVQKKKKKKKKKLTSGRRTTLASPLAMEAWREINPECLPISLIIPIYYINIYIYIYVCVCVCVYVCVCVLCGNRGIREKREERRKVFFFEKKN